MTQLKLKISPHITDNTSTKRIMLDVLIALMPAAIASVLIFGWRALLVIITTTASAVAAEYIFQKLCKRDVTVDDLSAAVTGLLLALNLPVGIELWQAALGSIIAIIVVKQLFGGIGKNFANPAITARIVLLISFPAAMSTWVIPGAVDTVSSATPLAILSGLANGTLPSLPDMLIGIRGGCLGETSAIALLLGGGYLLVRRVISWHTPVAFIGTVFVFTLLLGENAVYHVLSGGLLLGAFFMATDYSTTPYTGWGKIIFGIGCGIITVMIRVWGSYPEGISYAILLMNILTPYINKLTRTRPFGGAKA